MSRKWPLKCCLLLVLFVGHLEAAEQSRATKRLMQRFEKGKLATNPLDWGKVEFDPTQLDTIVSENKDAQALVDTIITLREAWIKQDTTSYLSLVTEDITLISQQSGKIAQGVDRVAKILREEWNSYERPAGVIAMQITIKDCILEIQGAVAKAQYWMVVKGGSRWGFSDLVLVCQFFKKSNGAWKLTYQTDSWGLDYDLAEHKPGAKTFDFDYVYPVQDLTRALAFYTPLLGEPEVVTDTRATFILEGPRFHLDTSTLGGHAEIQAGLPCGYAIFFTDDLDAERKRLKASKVSFLSGIETRGSDRYLICEDPSDNVFVIVEEIPDLISSKNPYQPKLTFNNGHGNSMNHADRAQAIMNAWLTMDAGKMNTFSDDQSSWFDDTRLRTTGIAIGTDAITAALKRDWQTFDRSSAGLIADMDITSVSERALGKWSVISYRRQLTGKGNHPFKETALVSQIFAGKAKDAKLVSTYIVRANNTDAPVMELDYTGYPVTSLGVAERFYTKVLRLGKPYKDSAYRGYWSRNSVFGIYTTKLKRDGMPRPHKTNGYVSFWINSAKETHAYLQKEGATFLKIPAINTRVGIDPQPGYTQILATDSEGNGVLFTEYPGN